MGENVCKRKEEIKIKAIIILRNSIEIALIQLALWPDATSVSVFSLNFSSAGKEPFMDGKAKNIYFSKRGREGGRWSEGNRPAFTGKFFIPIF